MSKIKPSGGFYSAIVKKFSQGQKQRGGVPSRPEGGGVFFLEGGVLILNRRGGGAYSFFCTKIISYATSHYDLNCIKEPVSMPPKEDDFHFAFVYKT